MEDMIIIQAEWQQDISGMQITTVKEDIRIKIQNIIVVMSGVAGQKIIQS